MKKRNVAILVICVSATLLIIGAICLVNAIRPKTYTTAKTICERVITKNQDMMDEIAVLCVKNKNDASGKFKNYDYSYSHLQEGFVRFEIGGQGMLGGQYWELVYTQDGTLYGETQEYLKETGSNNIIKAERLNEHWWYIWTDFDGTDRSYQ